jgi:hypothetical protein
LDKRNINNEYSLNHSYCNHISKRLEEVAIKTIALGAGILLVASIPLWGLIFKKGE